MLLVLTLFFYQITGNTAEDSRRVINGFLALDKEFMSTVAIMKNLNNTLRVQCTGFVVGKRTVATCRHCVDCNSFNNKYFVAAGSRNVKTGEQHEVVDIKCAQRERDVALLLVDKPFSKSIPIVRLPEQTSFSKALISTCQVAGWGLLKEKRGNLTHIQPPQPHPTTHVGPHPVNCRVCDLHHGVVAVLSRRQCQRKLQLYIQDRYSLSKDRSQVCTLPVQNQEACVGDSGAPVYCNGQVYGMAFAGHPTIDCATPDVPSKVQWMPFFREWIESIVKRWE